MSNGNACMSGGPGKRSEQRALLARTAWTSASLAVMVGGLLILLAGAPTRGDNPADKKDAEPEPARWTILFRADDPSVWNRNAKGPKGEQIAIPLKFAPEEFRYLRLRRMDTGEALILPLSPDQLDNGKPPRRETGFWWQGENKNSYGGFHLGIVQGPRRKFPEPQGMICVMYDGWDGFTGSGFGHKYGVNDAQYYCWRGKEIKRTVFEIAVSNDSLSPKEKRDLVPRR
jgi:hypothetical protein